MKATRIFLTFLLIWSFCQSDIYSGRYGFEGAGLSYAEGNAWKEEFEDICANTENAATYTGSELKALIERCDRLKTLIDKLEDTERRVYMKKLQMCRNLFAFMLESKEAK